jgi:uncharacterized protein
MYRKYVAAIVEVSSKKPWWVLTFMGAMFLGLGFFAQKLQQNVRTDFLELLPRDSPRFMAFEHQLGRVGGGAKLIVIVKSPDRKKNEKFIDDLTKRVSDFAEEKKKATAACAESDGACKAKNFNPVAYIESGTKDVRAFYESNKWLYADLKDLEKADDDLDRQIAFRGLVENLEDDKPKPVDTPKPPGPAPAPKAGAAKTEEPSKDGEAKKEDALGVDQYLKRWDEKANSKDTFPTGYFATDDGTALGIKIVSNTTLGEARGDGFLGDVNRMVEQMKVTETYHPEMQIGFTGDIASANDEKKALVSDAAIAFLIALGIIFSALIVYYRSLWALLVIFFPAFFGIASAYAFAYFVFGYINTAGAFLGAIILGNGINYPIVLLSRYQEFRARGMDPHEAKREAVFNAFRAELVGASVASIAYGSLIVTRFRGFSQFGTIGLVGMLAVWAAIIPLVPAMLAATERINAAIGIADKPPTLREDGSRSWLTAKLADVTTRFPLPFVAVGVAVTLFMVTKIPSYIKDPWEYDFGQLGSRSTHVSGANKWSDTANQVFGGKMNIAGALMLADTPEQVPVLKKQILENDRKDPEGALIADIASIADLLPGPPEEQKKKLEVLERIRDHLTPKVMESLTEDERRKVLKFRPPETLKVMTSKDVPPLLQRPFSENNGTVGSVVYIKVKNNVGLVDAHVHLRLSKTCDNVKLPDGTVVQTATSSTIYAEIIDSIRRDGPLASLVSLLAVAAVVILATRNWRGAVSVLTALIIGVTWLAGIAAILNVRINYVNFIAFPITFGIGCEYPFNISDRARLLGWNVRDAVRRSAGAVLLCSFTTVVGYGSGMFSDFQALESFGKLAVIGELACVFAAVFFMPSLLVLLQRFRAAPPTS